MSRTHHASKDARRVARVQKRASRRVDLEAMQPFMAGWRAQILDTYSREDIDRLVQSSREHRALARAR